MDFRLIGLALAALAIVSASYFAVQRYNRVIARNTELEQQIRGVEAERDTYKRITETQTQNEATTQKIVQTTHTKEIEIRNAPQTTQCVDAPAIGIALDSLRQQDTKAANPIP
jgi:hypothetical protein